MFKNAISFTAKLMASLLCAILLIAAPVFAVAQPAHTSAFDPASKVFRLDGGGVSYIFGINPRGELQQLYWGAKLGATDALDRKSTRLNSSHLGISYAV